MNALKVEDYLNEIAQIVEEASGADNIIAESIKGYYKDFADEILEGLENDIEFYCRRLSIQISLFTRLSTARVLNDIKNIDADMEKELDKKFEDIFKENGLDINEFKRLNSQFINASELERQKLIDEINNSQ